jgi:hypothetical protein
MNGLDYSLIFMLPHYSGFEGTETDLTLKGESSGRGSPELFEKKEEE